MKKNKTLTHYTFVTGAFLEWFNYANNINRRNDRSQRFILIDVNKSSLALARHTTSAIGKFFIKFEKKIIIIITPGHRNTLHLGRNRMKNNTSDTNITNKS